LFSTDTYRIDQSRVTIAGDRHAYEL